MRFSGAWEMQFLTAFSALLNVLFASAIFAQNPTDSTRVDTLRGVTISAARLPTRMRESALAVSMLDSAYIRTGQPQLTLQESLAAVPGVFVLNDANFAQDLRIAVRGFGARAGFGIRGIKLLLDGIPESAPDGQAQVDNLDLATVNRIEVLRGASGGLYGNASGGVISLSSDSAPEQPTGYVRLSGGSYGFRQLHVQAGTRFRNSGFLASLTHLGLDGYREHAALRSTLGNGKWEWAPDSASSVLVMLNFVDSPQADDPGALTLMQAEANRRAASPNNIRFNAGESVWQGRVGVMYEKKWPGRRELRLRGYSSWRDFENRLPFQSGGQVAFQRWFAGGGGQYTRYIHRWQFSAGFDLDRQTDERQRHDNLDGQRGALNLDQREIFTGAGLYALATWKPAPRWNLSGGARFDLVQLRVIDHFSVDGLQSGQSTYRRASPWGGISMRLHPHLQLYANATTNFETPTLNELSNNPANTGGFQDITPQRTFAQEAGLRGQWPSSFSWEIAVFRAVVRDELTPYELSNFPGRTFYRNAGKTKRRGLEVSMNWRPVSSLQGILAYTLARFEYEKYETPLGDFSGRELPGLPRQWGMLELRYTHRVGIFANGQVRCTGRYFADDGNTQAIDPYALLFVRVGYRRHVRAGQLEIFLGADNAVGTAWFNNIRLNAGGGRYYEPAAGLTVFGGVACRWQKE